MKAYKSAAISGGKMVRLGSHSAPVNHAPTDIILSANSIAENNSIGDVIGALSTTDQDSGNTFIYTLVSGAGSTDNASFSITGANLKAGIAFDFETKSTYSIRVRSTDQGGLYFEKVFTIAITDVYEEFAAYTTVYNAMTGKPLQTDRANQNNWLKGLNDLGVLSKAILLDNFAAHNSQASQLNWKAPGTTNPSLLNTPVFTAYKGFKGSTVGGSQMVRSNFTPSIHGAGFLGQNDITVIVGINDEVNEATNTFGSNSDTKAITAYAFFNGYSYAKCNNDANELFYSMKSKRYITLSRGVGTSFDYYRDNVKKTANQSSTGLSDSEFWLTGRGSSGVSATTPTFLMIFKHLTDAEIKGVLKVCDSYLKNYSTQIRDYQTAIDFNVIVEGHSFMIAEKMEDAILGNVNTITYANQSAGGSAVTDLVNRATTTDTKLIAETSVYKNITALWVGVNDIDNTAGKGAMTYAALKSYVQARITTGHSKIFVYTMTPSTSGGRGAQFEIERNIFNNSLRNDLSLLSGVYILDTDTISELTNASNATYFESGLHLTYSGCIKAGNLFKTKVAELYPV